MRRRFATDAHGFSQINAKSDFSKQKGFFPDMCVLTFWQFLSMSAARTYMSRRITGLMLEFQGCMVPYFRWVRSNRDVGVIRA